jgi:hypothetical protein
VNPERRLSPPVIGSMSAPGPQTFKTPHKDNAAPPATGRFAVGQDLLQRLPVHAGLTDDLPPTDPLRRNDEREPRKAAAADA